ncbi:hypothetical protein GZL_05398 [Streptomyces sp. 769]|nr:hypothetical protein GZL_05398 [Streptomyces sp. 769]
MLLGTRPRVGARPCGDDRHRRRPPAPHVREVRPTRGGSTGGRTPGSTPPCRDSAAGGPGRQVFHCVRGWGYQPHTQQGPMASSSAPSSRWLCAGRSGHHTSA